MISEDSHKKEKIYRMEKGVQMASYFQTAKPWPYTMLDMCAQTTGLLQDLLAVLPPVLPAKSSDSLSSPKSSSGFNC